MSDSTIDRLVGEVVKRVNPPRIVLFGSAAREIDDTAPGYAKSFI